MRGDNIHEFSSQQVHKHYLNEKLNKQKKVESNLILLGAVMRREI
jgi:hypothetical protein